MKFLERFLMAFLAVMAVFSLSACGDDNDDDDALYQGSMADRITDTSWNIDRYGSTRTLYNLADGFQVYASASWITINKLDANSVEMIVGESSESRNGTITFTFTDSSKAYISVTQTVNGSGNGDSPSNPGNNDDPEPDNPVNIPAPRNVKGGWDEINGACYTYLNWTMDYGKDYTYKVYRSTSMYGSYSMIESTKENSIADNNVRYGSTYYYKVKTFDSKGNSSDYSDIVEIALSSGGSGGGTGGGGNTVKAPNRPVITSVSVNSSGSMTVKWKMNSHPTCGDPDGYEILIHDYSYDTNFTITTCGKNATSATFNPYIHQNSDGWVMGGVKAYNDGGSETATFMYNYKTKESIYY